MPDDQQDAAKPILDPLTVDPTVKRAAWDAFHNAGSPEEFRKHFDASPIPTEAKRALWDAKFGGQQQQKQNSAAQPGAFQAEKGGQVYTDATKYLKDKAAKDEENLGALSPGTGEVGIGAMKGLASTGRSLGGLGIRAIRAIAPETGGKLASMWPEAMNGASEEMKPQSLPSKIGFGGEQAAEFAVPGGAVERGAKAAEAGIDAAKLGPVASKGFKLLTRGGLEAASSAGVTAAQGGSGKDIATNAGISAAMPAAGAALKPVAAALAEKAAPALANKLLRPVPTQIENAARFGRNPGQAIADEGIVATSHGDLVKRISDRKQDVGNQIGSMLKAAGTAGKTVDARAAIEKPINDAVQDVIKGKIEGGQAMIDRLEELRHTLTSDRQLVNGKLEVTGPKNLTLSPSDAHGLKRQIGDSTKWSEDQVTQAVNDVKRGIYRNLNEEVQKAVPSVKPHQDRYGNLLEAEKAAERESARHEARNPFGLTDMLSAIGAGGAYPGDFVHKAMAGAGGLAASKALKSPLLKTGAVQGLVNAPKAVSPEFLKFVRNAAFGAQSENRQ